MSSVSATDECYWRRRQRGISRFTEVLEDREGTEHHLDRPRAAGQGQLKRPEVSLTCSREQTPR